MILNKAFHYTYNYCWLVLCRCNLLLHTSCSWKTHLKLTLVTHTPGMVLTLYKCTLRIWHNCTILPILLTSSRIMYLYYKPAKYFICVVLVTNISKCFIIWRPSIIFKCPKAVGYIIFVYVYHNSGHTSHGVLPVNTLLLNTSYIAGAIAIHHLIINSAGQT